MKTTVLIKSILCSAVALLLCCGADAAPKKEKKEAAKKTFRVLYWNIQNGMWDGQGDNYDRFVAWVNEKKPDICIFCEASTIFYTGTAKAMPKEERYLPDHWGELCARWGHTNWFKSAQRDNYPQVVTSRFPIDSIAGFVGVKPDTVVSHAAGWCQVHVPGVEKPLNIITAHPRPFAYGPTCDKGLHGEAKKAARDASAKLYEGEVHRRKEVEFICNHTIRTDADAKDNLWIFAADFNAVSRKDNFKYRYNEASMSFYSQDYMIGADSPFYDLVAESFPGIMCGSIGKNRRIDFFYVTKPLLNACKNVDPNTDSYTNRWKDEPQISNFWHPSDHFPIIVDFTVSKLNK